MKYIIEHLEAELYPWCLIEYEQMSKYAGKKNLLFTKVPKKDHTKLKKYGEVLEKSVLELNLPKACLLDPKAKKILTPSDAKKFDYCIFGGILGDHPEQGRTEKYLTSKLKNGEIRNLEKKQMSTDTAVIVTDLIIKGTPYEKLTFKDEPEVILNKGVIDESVVLPYRYLIKDGKLVISKKLLAYLKM